MSISPPSDIIFDVAKAADSQKYRAAVEKLARATGAEAGTADFALPAAAEGLADSGVLAAVSPAAPARAFSGAAIKTALPADKRPAKAYQDFEAFFLQTFVESMLPKDASSLFGSGPAGNIWRSMLAEHLAKELAKSSEFGIAKTLAEHRATLEKAKAVNGATPSSAAPSSAAPAADDQASAYAASLRRLLAVEGERAATDAPALPAQSSLTKGS